MEQQPKLDGLGFLNGFLDETVKAFPAEAQTPILEVMAFRKTLIEESDRGCALMAAAFLDNRLADLMKQQLIDDKKLADELLDINGVFGTFSSRIEVLYGMGIIPKNVRRDLNLLRKIRNDFAHDAKPISFDDEPVSSRCRELALDGKDRAANPRSKFTRAMMGCLGAIEVATMQSQKPLKREDHDISINRRAIEELRDFFQANGLDDLASLIE